MMRMKQLLAGAFVVLLSASSAMADEALVRLDDPQLFLADAVAKMINIRFSDSFAAAHKLKTDYDGASISEIAGDRVCLFINGDDFDPASPAVQDLVGENGDVCVPRAEVSARVAEQGAAGAPPIPIYHTFLGGCSWQWKTGNGIGLWTEDCKLEQDHWSVDYDAANDWFSLAFNDEAPYPVVRQFRLAAGETMDTLLSSLKQKGLVLDNAECVFAASDTIEAPAGWKVYEVVPSGKLKDNFDALNSGDEVPEPPCGDLGLAVDYIGFFAVADQHPDRVVHLDLGQDGTMIAPFSVTFN
jgi:hypothetical protein